MMTILTPIPTKKELVAWPPQGEWSYEDYVKLPENGMRYEVVCGDLFMSPAPVPRHQLVSIELSFALLTHIKTHNLGRLYSAPIDVRLDEFSSVVQPDLLFIRRDRLHIVEKKYIAGAPDLIVEILSPSNPEHDRHTKFKLYADSGVQEYWIIDAENCTVEVFALRGNAYVPYGTFAPGEMVTSEMINNLHIAVNDICAPM